MTQEQKEDLRDIKEHMLKLDAKMKIDNKIDKLERNIKFCWVFLVINVLMGMFPLALLMAYCIYKGKKKRKELYNMLFS